MPDEAGRPYRATAHQFRHTLGTRLINSGVPQHVVQRLLGHATPQMTARYARIHDATVRAAFEDYCASGSMCSATGSASTPKLQRHPRVLGHPRRQRDHTAVLIATAEANGQFRLVDNHRRVAENLGNIITALEAMTEGDRGVV